MMTRSNFNQKTKLKILALFPASAVIFIITACINGLFPSHVKANSIAPIETSISQEFDSQQSKNLNSAEDTTKKVVVVGYGRMEDRSDVTILEDSDIADGVHVVGMKNISSDSTKSIENLENEGLKINATKKIGEKILTEHQNLNVTAVGVRRMENPKKINSDSINIEETRINYNTENGNRISVVVRKDGSNNQNLLYIVDGVPQPTDSDIKDIDPDKIESVSVLKNESATALYGEKAANGVILITTKGKSKQLFNFKADRLVIEGGNDKPIPNALYIIDGVKQSKEFDPNDLDPNQIKDITVLKDKDSIKLYTDKDHDGVLLITTKGK
jgi:TonB-dependent SusC/RagA subfamily outer membrane receptor